MTWETQYLGLVKDILRDGDPRDDRTGVGTIALFGRTLDIDLKAGFPLTTSKKTAWHLIRDELLWFWKVGRIAHVEIVGKFER